MGFPTNEHGVALTEAEPVWGREGIGSLVNERASQQLAGVGIDARVREAALAGLLAAVGGRPGDRQPDTGEPPSESGR
jgi:hypothetical protein